MKKISILLAGVLALGMWSCDESTNAVPQTNPQLPVMSADAVKIEGELPAKMDLAALNKADETITVGRLLSCANFPENYELKLYGQVGRTETFEKVGTFLLDMTEDSVLYTSPSTFDAAYTQAIGKGAKEKEVFFRIYAMAVNGSSEVRLGGTDVYYAPQTSSVLPYDKHIVIEEMYGLVGSANGWSVPDAILMKHSGLNPYDDPFFTHYFDVTVTDAKNGWWWKILPISTIQTGDWASGLNAQFGTAVNGDHSLAGDLIPMSLDSESGDYVEPQAGNINEAGVYNLVLDMENQTYDFEKVFDLMYVHGAYSLFDWAQDVRMMSTDENVYFGLGTVSGGIKLYAQPDYDGVFYGKGLGKGGLAEGSTTDISLKANESGFMMLVAHIKDLNLKREKITSLGLIGNHNGWGAQDNLTATDLTCLTWTGTVALDGEFKIRMNDNWDFNLGGAMDCLVLDGANLSAEAGTYDVTLNLATLPYSITLVKH